MKTNRYTEAQTLSILRQAEGGMPVAGKFRAHGMSNASLYKCRPNYGGMRSRSMLRIRLPGNRRVDDRAEEGL